MSEIMQELRQFPLNKPKNEWMWHFPIQIRSGIGESLDLMIPEDFSNLNGSLNTQPQAGEALLEASPFLHIFFWLLFPWKRSFGLCWFFHNQSTRGVDPSPFPQQIHGTAFLLYLKVYFSRGCSTREPIPGIHSRRWLWDPCQLQGITGSG